MEVEAFTDGGCKPNPGRGKWGWVAFYGRIQLWGSGGKEATTNQEMELTAMSEFLRSCPRGGNVVVWSDSKYVLGGVVGDPGTGSVLVEEPPSGWLKGWDLERGKKSDGNDLSNLEAWRRLRKLLKLHARKGTRLGMGWVKGHSGNRGNEIADSLCR